MVKNFERPEIAFLRASIEFRYPYLLFLKAHPIYDNPEDHRLDYKE